jgi:hypothetical protein|nr:MAG TPA: hypothetical protein [Caudoviricetes sp.]
MFNRILIEQDGYKFGKVQETISSVLGKNQLLDKLSLTGRALVVLLELFEEEHCIKSIIYFPNEKKR